MTTFRTIYGWPTSTGFTYDVAFRNILTGIQTTLATGITGASYGYDADDTNSGLLLVYPKQGAVSSRPYTFPINEPPCLSALRWLVRESVHDTDEATGVDYQYPSTPKFTDRELDGYIREGLQLFSTYWPLTQTFTTILEHISDGSVVFGSGVDVQDVKFFDDQFKQWFTLTRVRESRWRRQNRGWSIINNDFVLYGFEPTVDSDTQFEITWEKSYAQPYNDTLLIDLPKADWEIINLYCQGKCMMRVGTQDAQLSRWKEEGRRNDNPLIPMAKQILAQSEERMANKNLVKVARRVRR